MTNQKHDRDATLDRLLAGRAARGPADSTDAPVPPKLVFGGPSEGGCLDADTLAAWADDALGAAETAAAEAHAADCARCQALLAAMAKTAPPLASAPATAAWWMPSLRWLVPLTAAATAVLVWTMVPDQGSRSVTVRQVSEQAAPSPSATEPAPPTAPLSSVSAEPRRELQAKDVAADSAKGDLSRRSADLSRQSADANADLSRPSATGAEADKKTPASADTSVLADASARNARARPDRSRAAENAAAAPAAAAPPLAKTFSFGAPETVIVSSNPASRWRILQGGSVQRSMDGGATWQTQNTGISETLSGGSSPSPSVCWLVGPKGIVLRTTDGRSWTRVPFPEAVPLASVRATDDQTATVTTEDGRQFVTEDGGRTWARAPV